MLQAMFLRFFASQREFDRVRVYAPREVVQCAREFLRRRDILLQIALLLPMLVWFAWAALHYWPDVIDDSYITFRFSRNLIEGHGLRFNPGDMRVEGYTNFLWMLMSALFIKMNCDVMQAMKIVGLLCGIAGIIVTWRFAAGLTEKESLLNLAAPAVLATNAHYAFWSVQGMETQLQTLLVVATYHAFLMESRDARRWVLSPWLGVLAVLTRIDSLVFLFPLVIFGIWETARLRLPLRRLMLIAGIGLMALGIYFGWKAIYFGTLLPNTYYAKVEGEMLTEGRAAAHLYQFYFNQAGWDEPRAESALVYALSGGPLNGLAWINIWLFPMLACLFCARARGLAYVVAPVLVQAWYLVRIGADWMPGFRFFQVILPFLAAAGPLALHHVAIIIDKKSLRIAIASIFCVLLGINAVEQSRVATAYVFGPNPLWFSRDAGWWTPRRIWARLHKGFTPPLNEVAEELLMNTADGATILMSDVGQPLWYARHLNLIDVDGLTDKVIADSPDVRELTYGGPPIESVEVLEERLRSQGYLSEAEIRRRAAEQYQSHITARAILYVMDTRRPEYILAFEAHGENGPDMRGFVYPPVVSAAVSHPDFAQYKEMWRGIKTGGGVWNHLYRRDDVNEVPPEERLARLAAAARENPRMPGLLTKLYSELHLQGCVVDCVTYDELQPLLLEMIQNTGADYQSMHALLYLASNVGDTTIASAAYDSYRRFDNRNAWTYRLCSRAFRQAKEYERAAEILEEAIDTLPTPNIDVFVELSELYQLHLDRGGDAIEAVRTAAQLRPSDATLWQRLEELAELNGDEALAEQARLRAEQININDGSAASP